MTQDVSKCNLERVKVRLIPPGKLVTVLCLGAQKAYWYECLYDWCLEGLRFTNPSWIPLAKY